MADLMQRLVAESRNFDFFQALLLLEEYFRTTKGIRDPIRTSLIRMEADPSLVFPPSDVASIEERSGTVLMRLFFMGLIGVSSPLPVYFSEYVSCRGEDAAALSDFLAIFNHRLYALFYCAWKKYAPVRSVLSDGSDQLSSALASLAGITPSERSAERLRIIAYCSLLIGRSRSAAGLETLLSDFFGSIPVKVRQWQPRWTPIPDVVPLGRMCRLGVNAIAGTATLDLAGKFRISIGPLPRELYETFLPGSKNLQRLFTLVDSYLCDPLVYDIEIMLQSMELIPVVLGAGLAPVGITSALGRTTLTSGVHSIIVSKQDRQSSPDAFTIKQGAVE